MHDVADSMMAMAAHVMRAESMEADAFNTDRTS
jgi:hypothetical protein